MGPADQINKDLAAAMKARDKVKTGVLRMLKSEIHYKKIELARELADSDVVDVIAASAKRHRDSIAEFDKGGRGDLVAKEKSELEIVNSYLPRQLSEEELEELVKQVIAETNATTPSDIGTVMKSIMPKVKGRVDGRLVNELVSKKLRG